ncbi:MAG: hypothetical protein QGI09_05020 [Dehalococcoidia bacterium]|nr:hypothetical protein [Dehalococcoidia bacterium]
MSTPDKERERFEAWWKSEGGDGIPADKIGRGLREGLEAAWQAARAEPCGECARLRQALEDRMGDILVGGKVGKEPCAECAEREAANEKLSKLALDRGEQCDTLKAEIAHLENAVVENSTEIQSYQAQAEIDRRERDTLKAEMNAHMEICVDRQGLQVKELQADLAAMTDRATAHMETSDMFKYECRKLEDENTTLKAEKDERIAELEKRLGEFEAGS